MPEQVIIKTPNLDDIFERWKNSTFSKNKKQLEKDFDTKGAIFSLNTISAAEFVKVIHKEAAVYFEFKKTVASAKGKDDFVISAPRLSKETFYSFKGQNVNKDKWKGPEKVNRFETIKPVQCKACSGRGYMPVKCKACKGTGNIEESWTVLDGEEQKKIKTLFKYPCGECYGTGNLRIKCKECGGHKNLYTFQLLPVPIKTVVTGIPVLHSSAGKKYEREMEQDLHELLQKVEGIGFNDFKTLSSKAGASLGYINKNIKRTISTAESDYQSHEKDAITQIIGKLTLFPMIQLDCETKRGRKFEIYSIGSKNGFFIYSSF